VVLRTSMTSKVDKEDLAEALIANILLWKNPYDVFDARADSSLEDIHRKYKKISLQIHPDKCKLPKAVDAFDTLKKSLSIIEDSEWEDLRKQYQKVMEQARAKMRDMWRDLGKSRRTKEDEKNFEKDCKRMTQKLLMDIEDNTRRAEELKLANERREKDLKKKDEERIKVEQEHEQKWEQSREDRVSSWRNFQTVAGIGKKRKYPEDEEEPITQPPPPPVPILITPRQIAQSSTTILLPPPPAPKPEPVKGNLLGDDKKKKYKPKPLKPPKIKLS